MRKILLAMMCVCISVAAVAACGPVETQPVVEEPEQAVEPAEQEGPTEELAEAPEQGGQEDAGPQTCQSRFAAPLDPADNEGVELDRFAEDPEGDFALDHPHFTENFGVVFDEGVVPPALDIVAVEVEVSGGVLSFMIRTVANVEEQLFGEQSRQSQFGVFLDRDLNGQSDFTVYTVPGGDGQVVVVDGSMEPVDGAQMELQSDGLLLMVPLEVAGETPDWVVFSGYSPEPVAFRTPVDQLTVVPMVDLVHPTYDRTTLTNLSLSGSGQNCQVTTSGLSWCPPKAANPPQKQTLPGGASGDGWFYWSKECGPTKVSLWCDGGYFGRYVEEGAKAGWVAKCPFLGGRNSYQDWDLDGDNTPDRLLHQVTNGYSNESFDDDSDKCWDRMLYDYSFDTNLITITNEEYYPKAPGGSPYVADPDPASQAPPFGKLHDVPGTHAGPPVHPPGTCP